MPLIPDIDESGRQHYLAAPPKDTEEASARIKHWMGDLNAFREKLGLQPAGYYPKYSGHRSANAGIETMIAIDEKRNPSKWITPVAPVPSLRYTWQETLIRTRDDAKALYKHWTDPDYLKTLARQQIKKLWAKLGEQQSKLLGKLGEPKPKPRTYSRPPIVFSEPPPYDPDTYDKVKKGIAEEKTSQGDKKTKGDDPRNDGTLFT